MCFTLITRKQLCNKIADIQSAFLTYFAVLLSSIIRKDLVIFFCWKGLPDMLIVLVPALERKLTLFKTMSRIISSDETPLIQLLAQSPSCPGHRLTGLVSKVTHNTSGHSFL